MLMEYVLKSPWLPKTSALCGPVDLMRALLHLSYCMTVLFGNDAV